MKFSEVEYLDEGFIDRVKDFGKRLIGKGEKESELQKYLSRKYSGIISIIRNNHDLGVPFKRYFNFQESGGKFKGFLWDVAHPSKENKFSIVKSVFSCLGDEDLIERNSEELESICNIDIPGTQLGTFENLVGFLQNALWDEIKWNSVRAGQRPRG